MAVALTSLSHGAGCGCKLPPAAVHDLVGRLPVDERDDVLVGFGTSDDAGVVRVREDLALVQTVDFFTPIVDDPYDFGRIAATNALSDVWAMGGEPLSALSLVAWPLERLGAEMLEEVLRGGHDAVAAAGAAIVGGHSIDDAEPKYGLAVTGLVHPDEVLTNAGGQVGDRLVLTKPLGAGAVATAAKRGLDAPVAAAVEVMCELNRSGATAARDAGAHALTDVTGFGLLGHLHELASASSCAAEVEAAALPGIEGVFALLEDDRCVAGGSARNRAYAEGFASFASSVPEPLRRLSCDAMTSGGLLAAVPGPMAVGVEIGRLVDGAAGTISVV